MKDVDESDGKDLKTETTEQTEGRSPSEDYFLGFQTPVTVNTKKVNEIAEDGRLEITVRNEIG